MNVASTDQPKNEKKMCRNTQVNIFPLFITNAATKTLNSTKQKERAAAFVRSFIALMLTFRAIPIYIYPTTQLHEKTIAISGDLL